MMSDRKFEMLKGFAQVSNSLRACERDVLTSHSESKRTMSYCVWRRSALPSTIAFAWEGDGVGEEVVLSIQGILTGSDFRPPMTELS